MQVHQIKDTQKHQNIKGTGMNANPLTNDEIESGDHILGIPTNVIDNDGHCCDNDTPSPVIVVEYH